MLNQLLGGHYRIVQDLQEGGFAKTFIAEDHHRPGHPQCAVKYLKSASNESQSLAIARRLLPIARRLFKQEAEILEKLGQHDQIPRLLAYFEENEEFYLVQEFIAGHPLSKELPRGHCWSESKVIQMLYDVLRTLEFIHSFGVIHRDIKPDNLIRRQKDSRLVLIDFGAVKQVRAPLIKNHSLLTQKTIPIGTRGYMPTEQVRGKPRLNSDIYALGIIGIQALTGLHPLYFKEDQEGEVIWQDLAQVSDELAAILKNMVRYHFKDRYRSATEVLQVLQPLAHHYGLISLNSDRASSEAASESKLSEQQVSLEISSPTASWNPEAVTEKVTEKQLWKTKLVFPAGSSAPSKKLECSYASFLIPLNKSRLLIGAGIASVLFSLITGFTYIKHKQSYLQTQRALEHIQELKTAEKYQECLQQAQTFPPDYSDLQAEAKTLLHQCQHGLVEGQLNEAKKLAEQSRFKDAIAVVAQVSVDTDVYPEAQQLMSQWAEQIFQIASNKYQEGNLQEAIAIAGAVPADTPLAEKVQATIQQWDEDWQQNQTYLQTAQKAQDEGRWQDALNVAQNISQTAYWQKQSEPIIRKAKAEIATAQAAAARKNSQTSSSSSTAPRSRSFPRSLSNSLRSKSVTNSTSPRSRSLPRSLSKPRRSESIDWICLNNPNPKCQK